MKFKINKLARYTMPLFVAATLVACGGSSNNNDDDGGNADQSELNYLRKDASYDGWGLHIWNDDPTCNGAADSAVTSWDTPLAPVETGDNGAVYKIDLKPGATCVTYIMHKGNEKEPGGDRKWDMSTLGKKVYLAQGKPELSATPVALSLYEGTKGALIDASTVAWDTSGDATYEIHYLETGGFALDDDTGEITSPSVKLELTAKEMPEGAAKRYAEYKAFGFAIPQDSSLTDAELISGQLVLVAKNAEGKVFDATGVQLAPALDAVYATGDEGAQKETLGAIVTGSDATFKVWAPTAKNVSLYLYDDNLAQVGDAVTMTRKANGTWEVQNVTDALGKYYRYEVEVYHSALDKVETLQVTDPYSLSLSTNSLYSQVVDLAMDAKPSGWEDHTIPTVDRPEQLVIYETHLRDLTSAPNDGGTDALDGKYIAITETDRKSVMQLESLAQNGMNVAHLMNVFDIATVDEDPAKRVDLGDTVAKLCEIKASAAICDDGVNDSVIRDVLEGYNPETGDAQALMNDLRSIDSFNWGYDPFHYTTPEGSYATDAMGTKRIEEYRTLIMKLHAMGYRVVMDVVYNHTNADGIAPKSVLDKIVPGYYQRLNASGFVETSTCCSNTATENVMMGKLMTDSLVTWAKEYKIDGFRFDLMGHQPKQLMVDSLAAVKEVDPDTYFYGEGWNFGEVADNALFEQATQPNMGGTEIGTFSDRLRDAVRGGGPFDGGNQLRENQGFATAGVWNEMQADEDTSILKLREAGDLIRLGMAGNLANFVMLDHTGKTKRGQDVNYNGQKAGYTLDPQENISYVSKHDNQTLWDNNMYKAASEVSSADRARMQIIALSTNMFGQGIPFFHMGSELLRSKSMQRDSYDSGDWYNTVNFDMSSNNWNVGLPREDKDGSNWPLIKEIIADSNAKPVMSDIEWTDTRFKELLKIRTSSPLFSLGSASEVQSRVDFRNTGVESQSGVIVMSIDDGTTAGADLDPAVDAIVVVINTTNATINAPVKDAAGFTLHTDLVDNGSTFSDGTFTVPALTTAVFVQSQGASQGAGLPVDNSNKDLSSIPPFGDDIPHIRGDMNGWGTANAMEFTTAGVYNVTMTLDAGTYGFKVADPTWGPINYGGSGALTVGDVFPLNGGDNISLTLDVDSVVTFKFDASDKSAATLLVTAVEVKTCELLADSAETGPVAESLAVRGAHSGWGWDIAYALNYKGNNTYQVALSGVDLSGGFKLAADTGNWDPQVFAGTTTSASAMVLDAEYDAIARIGSSAISDPGNNTLALGDGNYVMSLVVTDFVDAQKVGTMSVCEVK
ncbi:pullulanase-type alpha-1,6-glucosidase [Psychromonas sp. MME1]|uniref:pullulanase-type alpha-1,6-glucosidase n=2 Tax=unclassified Psychromonas TaxID=2614957 RepID=UPI0034E2E631